jgi:hypothetical protein
MLLQKLHPLPLLSLLMLQRSKNKEERKTGKEGRKIFKLALMCFYGQLYTMRTSEKTRKYDKKPVEQIYCLSKFWNYSPYALMSQKIEFFLPLTTKNIDILKILKKYPKINPQNFSHTHYYWTLFFFFGTVAIRL